MNCEQHTFLLLLLLLLTTAFVFRVLSYRNTVQKVKEESMKLKEEAAEQLKAEEMETEHRLEWKKKVRAFRQVTRLLFQASP